jgi:glutamate-1-semialdehyde 2,1-aminomutase
MMATMEERQSNRSVEMFQRITKSIAGGESSYARLRAGIELCIERTGGARMWDVDGNEYIDYCLGYGPMIFGHQPKEILDAVIETITQKGVHFTFPHELDYEVGEAIQRLVPSIDLIRFACSGTEATMAAMRLARAYTGREKIIKFEGCYHGWSDLNFVSYHPPLYPSSGLYHAPRPVMDSTGMVPGCAEALIIQPFNDLELIEKTIRERHFEIAAIMLEPIMGSCGVIPPREGFLEGLRSITKEYGILLIFDEVMTGFRVAAGGAQEYYNIQPDISTFAKAMASGFPVACFGGTSEVMALEANNEVVHGGTYTASPLGLSAAHATLRKIENEKETMYPDLFKKAERLRSGLERVIRDAGIYCFTQGVGPFFHLFFGDDSSVDRLYGFRETCAFVREDIYPIWHEEMQKRGIYFHPGPFERYFISTAHTDQDIDLTIETAADAIRSTAKRIK